MPDWKTYKGQFPWLLSEQGNVLGYVNNPRWTVSATNTHKPCGYWFKRDSGLTQPVWKIEGCLTRHYT